MRLEVSGVDHERVGLVALTGQFQQHLGKDTFLAPPLPAAVQSLVRTIGSGRVPPAQAIAIDEDNSAEDTLVIDARLVVRLWGEGCKLRHLRVVQPV